MLAIGRRIQSKMAGHAAEIAIVGAGMAGLSAGRALAEAGRDVIVVEARDRIGGRILTVDSSSEKLELGAEFVHGKPPELWRLLNEAELSCHELDGDQVCWDGRKLLFCDQDLEQDFRWIEALKTWRNDDCSFADYLDRASVPEKSRARLIAYVEGFNAADHRLIGVASLGKQQAAEDAIEGDRLFRVRGGYCQLPGFLARKLAEAKGRLLLNTQVHSVQWRRGGVALACGREGRDEEIRASKIIITVPLSILQQRCIHFDPMPDGIVKAASEMRMGDVSRDVLLFRDRIWESQKIDGNDVTRSLERLGFLYSFPTVPSVWWTQFPEVSRTLTAWTGGPRSRAHNFSNNGGTRQILKTLAEILDRDAEDLQILLENHSFHDWRHDPFSLGAYSYVSVGAIDASNQMCKPLADTLYFAGEHTDTTGHWGTVHGALRSGIRVAAQILDA
jgi:monoamine oxidase